MSIKALFTLILISLLIFFWTGSIAESEVLKPHPIIVSGPIYFFMSSSACFIKFGVAISGEYIFIIVIST
jgi:hypothetical protein